jgi:hypothetical protein
MTALWVLVRPHLFWIVLISGGLFFFRMWLSEHDARILADVQVKESQSTIDQLRQQIAAGKVETQKQVQVIIKEVQAAKTPAQQIAEINKLAQNPIHAEPVLSDPSKVLVDLAPMLEEESECRQQAVKLGACEQEIKLRDSIDIEQGKQVAALKKKPGFWHRVADTAKKVAIGVGVGIVTAVVIRGKV